MTDLRPRTQAHKNSRQKSRTVSNINRQSKELKQPNIKISTHVLLISVMACGLLVYTLYHTKIINFNHNTTGTNRLDGKNKNEHITVSKPTPLMAFAYHGDINSVRQILQEKSPSSHLHQHSNYMNDNSETTLLKTLDHRGWSPLHYALQGRHDSLMAKLEDPPGFHEDVVDELVKFGFGDNGACPIYYAITFRDIAALHILTKALPSAAIAECLLKYDMNNETALHILARSKASGFARLFRPGLNTTQSRAFSLVGLQPTLPVIQSPIYRGEIEDATVTKDMEIIFSHMHPHDLSCNILDKLGRTPLHIAAMSGRSSRALKLLIESLACDIHATDVNGNTPFHLAVAFGYCTTTIALAEVGSRWDIPNARNVTPTDLACTLAYTLSCASSTECSSDMNGHIDRDMTDDSQTSTSAQRFASHEATLSTPCPEINAENVNLMDFIQEFVRIGQPVIIRDYLARWPAQSSSLRFNRLGDLFGDVSVAVSSVPYADTYGHSTIKHMQLKTFLTKHMRQNQSNSSTDSVCGADNTTCMYVFDAQVLHAHPTMLDCVGLPFVANEADQILLTQFMIGPAGTGASPHFHGQALNVLIEGTKRWALYPPENAFFHVMTAHEWFYHKHVDRQRTSPIECVQRLGDALFVPYFWGHAVLNEEPVVAVSFEFL
eukprot:gene5116-155_t